jgi:hypothetical protein
MPRREMLGQMGLGLGGLALAQLLGSPDVRAAAGGALGKPHFAPRVKRVIHLVMAGGPSQMETFDHKPVLRQRNGEELPPSVRRGQRLTGMSGQQSSLSVAGPQVEFRRHGNNGTWVSDLLPHTAGVVDDLCIVRSMYTDAINHDPGVTLLQTGSQLAGRPSIGSWVHYGLGSDNENLPAFVVLVARAYIDQPLYARLWGSGFLPSRHQGVQLRAGSDPVPYLHNPPGLDREARRLMLDGLRRLHQHAAQKHDDAEIESRIAQYEMAYRMQTSVPEVMNLSGETEQARALYGPDVDQPGTFASCCLLARRLVERGVKFVQLYHQGWDNHETLPRSIRRQCRQTDQACAGLVADLKARGLLDDTLVIWGGEFGRTAYSQGRLTANDFGRDHHPRCFTMWFAGAGVKAGLVYGETDDFSYNIVRGGVHVHDFQATLLHLLGIDHERLTFKYQGRRFRLTDVAGRVIKEILG